MESEVGCVSKTTCPAGHFCPLGTRRPTEYPCAAGTYQPTPGASAYTACLDCPKSSYCPQGSKRAYPCPPGSYCPETTHADGSKTGGVKDPQQHLAKEGYLIPGTASETTVDDGSTVLECAKHYCPPGSSRSFPCPAGFYAADTYNKATDGPLSSKYRCTLCEAGKVCPTVADTDFGSVKSFSGTAYKCKKGYLCPLQTENWE